MNAEIIAICPPYRSAIAPKIGPVKPHISIWIPMANPKAVLLIFKLWLKSIKNKPKVCLTPREIKTTKHAANKVITAVFDLKNFSDIISDILELV